MKLPLELAEAVFRRLNEQQYFEVRRMSGDDYVFSLSPSGRKLAAERALSSRYAGPAPVSLKSWTAAVRAQVAQVDVTREKLRRAFCGYRGRRRVARCARPGADFAERDLSLRPQRHRKNNHLRNGSIARLRRRRRGPLGGRSGRADHHAGRSGRARARFDVRADLDIDPRWMICRRPFLAVGGELVTSMLDLQKDEATGSFSAPLQMKANNGILLIDDFGRQMMSPRDLLNRWIVPLDRRVDFLSLGSGGKFDIPFELQVVFSTNLAPHELADEAFLRRIPNKILSGSRATRISSTRSFA